jgi:hypothetical protein
MLKQVSQKLAATQAFSYSAEQEIERVRAGDERVTERFSHP